MKKRRLMAAAMAAVMLTGTLAGCSAKSETSGTEAAKGDAGGQPREQGTKRIYRIFKLQ